MAAARDAFARFAPQAMLVGASCTAELIQDDPGGLARTLGLPVPVVPLELPSYQKKENWGAAETFYRLVRAFARPRGERPDGAPPRANILGPTALGFRHRDDVTEVRSLLARLGVEVNVVAPEGATPADLARLTDADFNVVLYPETAGVAAAFLQRQFGMPMTRTVPIGVGATRDFLREVATLAGTDAGRVEEACRLPWYSRSVDSTYLTGKRSSSSATRRTPSPRHGSRPRNSASPSSASAPIRANSAGRCGKPRRRTGSRRWSPTTT